MLFWFLGDLCTIESSSIPVFWILLLFQGGQSLADKFEYIMHGRLYKISDEPQAKTSDGGSGPGVNVYVSIRCLNRLV